MEKLNGWKKAGLILAEGMQVFGEGLTGKDFGSGRTREAMQRYNQQQRLLEMRQDAELGLKGYERLSPEDTKEYLTNKMRTEKTPALGKAEGGVVGLADGSTFKDGQIFDKDGSVVGEYAEGYEPKPAKFYMDRTGDYLTIGGNYYRWNPDLAGKMSGLQTKPQAQEIHSTLDKINQQLKESGRSGAWEPSTTRAGGNTFRYNPYGGFQPATPMQQTPPAPFGSPAMQSPIASNQPSTGEDEVRRAIMRAIQNGESQENIIEGIKAEGYDPQQFADLFQGDGIEDFRKSFLDSIAEASPLPKEERKSYIDALSQQVSRRRKNKTGAR
jgi:hypothetical protein